MARRTRVADAIDAEATGGRAIVVGLSLGGYVAMDARGPLAGAGPRASSLAGATAEPIGPRSLPYLRAGRA